MTKEQITKRIMAVREVVGMASGRNASDGLAVLSAQLSTSIAMTEFLGEIAVQLQELNHHLMVRDGAVQ